MLIKSFGPEFDIFDESLLDGRQAKFHEKYNIF